LLRIIDAPDNPVTSESVRKGECDPRSGRAENPCSEFILIIAYNVDLSLQSGLFAGSF
jgi:hypothetical protein